MEFWFSEEHTPNVKFSIRVDRQLYSGKSEFQRIDVFDSPEFGRFLTLDGYMMLTEKDEFIYHEMITHVPMAVHPHVEKVLVIGAGDGGVIRELVQYQDLQHIDMVEIDPLVVEVCKKYLPKTACRLEDPRLTIHYEDGLKFIRSRQEEYDLIIPSARRGIPSCRHRRSGRREYPLPLPGDQWREALLQNLHIRKFWQRPFQTSRSGRSAAGSSPAG